MTSILIVVGIVVLLLYAFNNWIPASPNTKMLVNVVTFVLLVVWIFLHTRGII